MYIAVVNLVTQSYMALPEKSKGRKAVSNGKFTGRRKGGNTVVTEASFSTFAVAKSLAISLISHFQNFTLMTTTPKVCEDPEELIEALRRFKDQFRSYFPDLPDDAALAFDFPAENIMNLLNVTGTTRIRVYPALVKSENGQSDALTIVLVSVDTNGEEIIKHTIAGDFFNTDCCIHPPEPGHDTGLSRRVDNR